MRYLSLSLVWLCKLSPRTLYWLGTELSSILRTVYKFHHAPDTNINMKLYPGTHNLPEPVTVECSRIGTWAKAEEGVRGEARESCSRPMAPSASFMAQNLRKAMALSATSSECGLLVKAMRQFTQSVKVVTSVSVMYSKCSRTIFSIVSKASRTIIWESSLAAVVKTMKTDFQPDFTFLTLASTIWETHLPVRKCVCGRTTCTYIYKMQCCYASAASATSWRALHQQSHVTSIWAQLYRRVV